MGDVTPTPNAAFLVDVFDGRQLGANGALSGFYYPLQGHLVSNSAVVLPQRSILRTDNLTSKEVFLNLSSESFR